MPETPSTTPTNLDYDPRGAESRCHLCGGAVRHLDPSGRRYPLTEALGRHFEVCPERANFLRRFGR